MGKDELREGSDGSESRILTLHEITDPERNYFENANALREARVRYAQAFQVAKMGSGKTDELARQIAIEMTQDEITLKEAVLRIAEERL